MRSFFKMFFASLLSILVFFFILLFLFMTLISRLTTKDKPEVREKSVLVIDLNSHFDERMREKPFANLSQEGNDPGLFDVIRLIQHARDDENIAGIYLQCEGNGNGAASSNEIRNALLDFRTSKKFVFAYGDVISQQAYFVASAADRIYVNPSGLFEWTGFNVTLPFIKGMLDKLDIKAQVFYAGKYKSATEIFRTDRMTPENRQQTSEWLGDMYGHFLEQTFRHRGLDTATLHRLANEGVIRTPQDALVHKLVDGVKYDDEVKEELKKALSIGKYDKLNFIYINTYNEAINLRKGGSDRIAVIYAEGDIVDGLGGDDNIGGDNFRRIIRKARLDKSVKALVLRVNSGGGSALASENIWRELQVARQDGKPVVVSFGDVAASGGYYIACGADSIFANPNTITGSIGVFGIIPDMQAFFRNKLGITFDGVKTAPYADLPSLLRPLTAGEQKIVQAEVERIYQLFKIRVAEGRKKDTAYIDSIAQGRVWSGADAMRIGLVDRMGNLQDAIRSAAKLAGIESYGLKEYPETQSWYSELIGRKKVEPAAMIRKELGEDQYRLYRQLLKIREMSGSVQARLPFEIMMR